MQLLTVHVCSPVQVHEVAKEAIARARRGDGPTLIECETYRFRGHSLADPDELRKKEEKEHYQVRAALSYAIMSGACTLQDPILRIWP